MKTYGRVEVLNSALDESEWLAHAPAALPQERQLPVPTG
jgi:hypothetical protein